MEIGWSSINRNSTVSITAEFTLCVYMCTYILHVCMCCCVFSGNSMIESRLWTISRQVNHLCTLLFHMYIMRTLYCTSGVNVSVQVEYQFSLLRTLPPED